MALNEAQVLVRVPADLRAELEAAAAGDRRTMSSYLRNLLSDWSDSRKALAQLQRGAA
jgi:hypothetical protein